MAKDVVIRFTGDPADLQRALKQVQSGLGEVEKQSQSMGDKLQAAGGKMSAVGGKLTRSVTLPLAAIGGAALKTSADFDGAMSKIVGLVGLGADEVDDMRESVLRLAGQTAKSPQELAEALFAVTSAGLRGQEALDALELSAKASAAGLGETKAISLTLAAAMTAYQSEGLSAAEATDILTATVREGNLEASDLAGSLGRILPVAQSAGVGLEEVGASIALMTRSGLSSSESVTALRAALLSMNAPTTEASAALEAAGLSAEQLRTVLAEDGVIAAMELVEDAAGGDETMFRKLLGSTEALTGAQILLAADSETVASVFDGVADSTGALDAAFDAAAETSGFKMKQAMAEVQTALVEVGDAIAPFATVVADGIGKAASAFANLPGPVQNGVLALAGVAAAAGPFLTVTGKMVTGLGKLANAAPTAWSAIKAGGPVLVGLGAAFLAARALTDKFNDGISSVNEVIDDLAGSSTEALVTAFNDIASEMEGVFGKTEAARAQLAFFEETAESNIATATRLRDALAAEGQDVSALDKVLTAAAAKQVQMATDTDATTDAVSRFGGETGAAVGPTDDLTDSLDDEKAAADRVKAAVDAVTEATDRLIGVNISAEEATLRAENQFASLTETLNENGGTLDINSEKGRANREAILGTANAALSHVEALKEQGASTDEVNWVLSAHVERLKDTMRQAGMTEDQIADYIRTLGLTPDNIATIVQLNGVAEAEQQLNWVARDRTTRIYATTIGETGTGRRAFHTGGEFHAPRPGGEGLALLRDGERVSTPTEPASAGHGGMVTLDPASVRALASEIRRMGRAS